MSKEKKIIRAHEFATWLVFDRMALEPHAEEVEAHPQTADDIIEHGIRDAELHRTYFRRALKVGEVSVKADVLNQTFPQVAPELPASITEKLPEEVATDPIALWYMSQHPTVHGDF